MVSALTTGPAGIESHCYAEVADIVLADHDPIARQVLSEVLSEVEGLDLVACVDSRQPVRTWPIHRATIVVLCLDPEDELRDVLVPLVEIGARVLVVSTFWDRRRLDQALTLGAKGCLVKDNLPQSLACAVKAIKGNHCVISPELINCYLTPNARSGRAAGANSGEDPSRRLDLLTGREREILELLAAGTSTSEIASHLVVTSSTVKSHISRALSKLHVRNRLEAVLLIKNA